MDLSLSLISLSYLVSFCLSSHSSRLNVSSRLLSHFVYNLVPHLVSPGLILSHSVSCLAPSSLVSQSRVSSGVPCFSELLFLKEPTDTTVLRRDPVLLDCRAQGERPIHIRWLKNKTPVLPSDRVHVFSNGSLFVSEAESRRGERSDEGSYQCLAQNKFGAILSQTAHLSIASKCHHHDTRGRLTWRLTARPAFVFFVYRSVSFTE